VPQTVEVDVQETNMINYKQSRIVPELYSREDEDESIEDDEVPKNKTLASDHVMGIAQKFAAQRKELKEKIVKEVMESAFPDMNDFNVNDFVIGKPIPPKPNKCLQCLQFFGCWPVTIHEAIENGSMPQLEKALLEAMLKVEKEIIDRDFINELNVSKTEPKLCILLTCAPALWTHPYCRCCSN
jgi:hypothetical protein